MTQVFGMATNTFSYIKGWMKELTIKRVSLDMRCMTLE
ncbi:hypothetical protein AC96_5166 [Escherichia coli 2-156-04_S4_C2]|nr:hypothetical protein AC96_5166 [Escherichia coli 2-156-04_S4_C2]RAL71423.1 hypothetical protein CSC35_5138 [Enterobacter hormaechei]